MKPKFEPIEDGLEIIDPIERHRYRLTTHEPVTPAPVDSDRIQYPVDAAVEITTDMLTLPTKDAVYVRDKDGAMLEEIHPSEQQLLPQGKYTLDLSLSLKVYVQITSTVHVYSDRGHTHISFDKSTRTIIGARSYHTRPAEMITTTAEPTDIMEAVSVFGSALKTKTPERSYPTLRGHPPALELGDKLCIPDRIEQPQTDIQIEVPPTLQSVFVVTPLSYYLGATIESGSEPRLITESGYSYSLENESERGFESVVERVLKQVFFLDCVVRTEGTTPLPLRERQSVESVLEFDLETVYNQPLTEQLKTFLNVPFEKLESYLPDWQLETQLKPSENTIEFLPFIADDLSIVNISERNEEVDVPSQRQAETQAIKDFTRDKFTRSTGSTRNTGVESGAEDQTSISTIQQSWSGTSSTPITSTTPLSAYHNSIGRSPREGPISIEVVCNDPDMEEELDTVNGVYKNNKQLPFDVTVHHELKTGELEGVFAKDSDFCHYIGHIDDRGFQCSNGKLDASTLDTVGTKAFLLNGCQSHDQGLHLVESGSIGGIVTLGDIINSGAVKVGSTIARLLNRGFPLYAALDITRKENVTGQQYRIVGDGITTIAQSETRSPMLCSISSDKNSANIMMYSAARVGKGGLCFPYLEPIDSYCLLPGETGQIPVTESQLERFFELEDIPVLTNGEIRWSSDIDVK